MLLTTESRECFKCNLLLLRAERLLLLLAFKEISVSFIATDYIESFIIRYLILKVNESFQANRMIIPLTSIES